MIKLKILEKIFIYGSAFMLIIIISFPILSMVSTSLKSWGELWISPTTWIPKTIYFNNYINVWQKIGTGPGLAIYFRNSIIIAGGTTLLSLMLSMPAAYAVSRYKFKGRKEFMLIILIIQMITPIILIMSLFKIMKTFGLLNTYLGIILITSIFSMPYNIWVLLATFNAIPTVLDEAAMLDGCSELKILFKIIIPLSWHGIITAMIYAFIYGWSDFLISLTFLRSSELMPVTVGIYNLLYSPGTVEIPWHEVMSSSILSAIPVILLFSIIRKYLVRGFTVGAIKG